ncbi:hypothetical protein M758_1G188500 [Ceratodon purpureus]|nr:hypothetical protein M758_1G188500 [Ceratodon purpureus]
MWAFNHLVHRPLFLCHSLIQFSALRLSLSLSLHRHHQERQDHGWGLCELE